MLNAQAREMNSVLGNAESGENWGRTSGGARGLHERRSPKNEGGRGAGGEEV